eukprot:6196380-Pleurochrysis_carterae.AAC.2
MCALFSSSASASLESTRQVVARALLLAVETCDEAERAALRVRALGASPYGRGERVVGKEVELGSGGRARTRARASPSLLELDTAFVPLCTTRNPCPLSLMICTPSFPYARTRACLWSAVSERNGQNASSGAADSRTRAREIRLNHVGRRVVADARKASSAMKPIRSSE